jgi:hypothetical protein
VVDASSRATHHEATLFDRLRLLTAVVALVGAVVLLVATRPWRLVGGLYRRR